MNLINKAAVRRRALEYASNTKRLSTGQPRFTRVSPGFILHVEAAVHAAIQSRVNLMTSSGRTLI